MAGRLDGKVCVITGAASGIGADSALLFDEQGATVVGVDVAPVSVGAVSLQADVTDPDQVRGVYDRVREELGRIDVRCCSAASTASRTCSPTTRPTAAR
jgi:NAD(P)-dependent dehydrogenase (short-subunit alcohol dehydrogenase family)